MEANKTWLSISKEYRSQLLSNVWCMNCSDVTTIKAFIVEEHKLGIVLVGKCKNCGDDVSRFIEQE